MLNYPFPLFQVSRVELLDEVQMMAINIANGYNYAELPTLMFELIGTEAHVAEQVATVRRIAEKHGGGEFKHAETEEDKKELWRARKEALWAGATLKPGTEPLITVWFCVSVLLFVSWLHFVLVHLTDFHFPLYFVSQDSLFLQSNSDFATFFLAVMSWFCDISLPPCRMCVSLSQDWRTVLPRQR